MLLALAPGCGGADGGTTDAGHDAATDQSRPLDASEDTGTDASDDMATADLGSTEDTGVEPDAALADQGLDATVDPDLGLDPDLGVPTDAGYDAGNPCSPSPCVRGTCSVSGGDFVCNCPDPYTGETCELIRQCTGTPSACAVQSQTIACSQVPGCATMPTCTGTPLGCAAFNEASACADQQGCTFDAGTMTCSGIPTPCSVGTCNVGCSMSSVCAGTPSVGCGYFGVNLTQCAMVGGCSVTTTLAP